MDKFSSFLKELAESDTDFFTYNKQDMMDEAYRRRYIINLEIPCHKTFKFYMFYDVLILMCRDICMREFYPKLKRKYIEKRLK